MKRLLMLVVLMFLTSCASIFPPITYHSLDGWTVVYNDWEGMVETCNNSKIYGCADYRNKIIYCDIDDYDTCGHELKHITHGSWH